MFWRLDPEPDLERTPGQEDLQFDDPSWIIDHHRHNIILRVYKPERASPTRFRNTQFSQNAERHGNNNQTETKSVRGNGQDKGDDKTSKEREHSYRINFSELQRLHLRQLQHKLIQHAVDLRYNASEPAGWAEDLRQYVQALQDFDYMGKHIELPKDPFYVTGERFIERCMLQVAMKNRENDIHPLQCSEAVREWETEGTQPAPIGGTRNRNFQQAWVKDFRKRIGVAMVGGIFLIAPMWLMVLHNTLYISLVATTVCVALFGLLMASVLEKPIDVMSGTAAYAAVLVVFVGLTTSNKP
uniref:DUF6594 domain-containing protein n=1 Tax=Talaromyces marneffei PM1 TaxID=1077442 RepID=A0A093VFN2_TALMA